MAEELVVLGQTDIQKGGLGLNSRIFSVSPSTIEIVQKMTHQESAIPGKLRVTDTNQHYDEMQVVLLVEPMEQRAYFEGQDYSKDSKICFSLDNVEPHDKAKIPQAVKCGYRDASGRFVPTCPRASWDKYREAKKQGISDLRPYLPKCREYWHCVLADRVTQLPYYLNVKGKSIEPFKKGMGNVAKMIHLMRATAENDNKLLMESNAEVKAAVDAGQWHPLLKTMPNIFDVSFKICCVPQEKGTYWTLGFKDIAPLKQEDRAKFGALFLEFANRKATYAAQAEEAEQQAAAADAEVAVDASVIEPPAGPVTGEIVI
jgi:hypothetical protein